MKIQIQVHNIVTVGGDLNEEKLKTFLRATDDPTQTERVKQGLKAYYQGAFIKELDRLVVSKSSKLTLQFEEEFNKQWDLFIEANLGLNPQQEGEI